MGESAAPHEVSAFGILGCIGPKNPKGRLERLRTSPSTGLKRMLRPRSEVEKRLLRARRTDWLRLIRSNWLQTLAILIVAALVVWMGAQAVG